MVDPTEDWRQLSELFPAHSRQGSHLTIISYGFKHFSAPFLPGAYLIPQFASTFLIQEQLYYLKGGLHGNSFNPCFNGR